MSAIISHIDLPGGQQIGQAGENAASHYLIGQGLKLLARNFRVKGGEIDLVCQDGTSTVFVEVRCRSVPGGTKFGGAIASITLRKQRRLILAARHWLARHGETPCRFDCVLIDGDRMEWLKDAFRAD